MKKSMKLIAILIGLGVLVIFFIAIVKYSLFTDSETKFYQDGWTAYENKQYDLTVFYLSKIDKKKFPDAVAPLGFSYFEKKDFENALVNLQEAYDKKIGEKEGYYDKICNSLGICYMEKKDFSKSKFYLEKAKQLGNPYSKRNLQILDSLEQALIK